MGLHSKISQYTSSVEKKLVALGIRDHHLTSRNQSSLHTLKGLIEKYNGKNSRYCRIDQKCRQAIEDFGKYKEAKFILRYHPSLRLYHSIRLKNKTIIMNFSQASLTLPDTYFYYLMLVLLSRLTRSRPRKDWLERLREYEISFIKKQRDKPNTTQKNPLNPIGQYFDLEEIFRSLNKQYFSDQLPAVNIGWSHRKNFRRLGSYDGSRKLIRISRILDQPDVPDFVVKGIVYHEMLHIIHPIQQRKYRRMIHSPEFKRDEKKFESFTTVQKWLKDHYPGLVKKPVKPVIFSKLFY